MLEELDAIDRHLLVLLQQDASRSTAELADLVGLSQAPCWRRIQRLKDVGILQKQVYLVDRRKIGLNAQLYALVKLTAHARGNLAAFEEAIRDFPEVQDCYVLLGSTDFILRIVTRDIESYEQFFLKRLASVPGIQEVNSMVALSEIKHTLELPIERLTS
ncbi:Lrp/AsnC family transcriptional regulator [Asaia siamensis]